MSISIMDWSRRSSNGAIAHTNNQQYLPQSTSSTVPTLPSHTACVAPNTYSPAQTFATNSGKSHTFLKRLLDATSSEEISKIQRYALTKTAMQQTTQVSPGQYNSSFSPLHKTTTNHQSSRNVQNPVVSSYQMQGYPNSVPQSLQQARSVPNVQQQVQLVPVAQQQAQLVLISQQQAQMEPISQQQAQMEPIAQQQSQRVHNVQQQAQRDQFYGANGYNTRESQQLLQNGRYSHKKAYQQMPDSSAAKRYSRNVQTTSWQTMQQPNPQTIYSIPNGNSGSYTASCHQPAINDTNVPVSTSNYQNGQNIQSSMGSNCQTNTLQPQMTDYVQSPQRQMMPSLHSGYANNSSNVFPSATVGQMPPLHRQSSTNASNVYNVSVNQKLSHPSQNVVQNVQQPVQSYTVAQDQHSVAVPPPAYPGNITKDNRLVAQNILALLKVYEDVKRKYLSLNRENNLLRQKMQNSSQDNSGSGAVRPPLISSLPHSTVSTNDPMGGQEVTQNVTLQSQPLSNATHGVQTPTLYDNSINVPLQSLAQLSNSFSSHGYPTDNSDVSKQINYTGFDSGQMNIGSSANSSGQGVGSETIGKQDPQDTSAVSTQANNQYHSSVNFSKGNLSQDGVYRTSHQSLAQTPTASSESCNPVNTTNVQNLFHLTSNSREAIKASLTLWKSVPQSPSHNKSGYPQPEQQHMVDVNGLDTVHPSNEIATNSINEPTATVTLTQKLEHSGTNVSKGIEPQIAIVSPLVQMKCLANELNQHHKGVPQGENLANDGGNGLKENDCFNKLLLALESVDVAAGLNNPEDGRSRSIRVSSSSGSKVSSNDNVDQNSTENFEPVDESLQISSICTLVKGNSFFDSSIAMMFEGSLQAQPGSPLAKTDPKSDCAQQCSQDDVNICGASPGTEMVAVKPEPQEVIEPCVNIEDDRQKEDVHLEIQPEKNLDLESNTVSDQLSELLTEFPFGIKNYMSEYQPKSTVVSLGKFTVKPDILKTSVTSCDNENDGSIEDPQMEYAMDTSTKEMEFRSIEETDQQSIVERVPTPELPTDVLNSEQLEDDGFEISDSPDGNIHITLLDQDQIDTLFPEDSTKPIVQSEESVAESFARESRAPVVDVAVSSIKETSDNKTASVPDKEPFCCFLGWLTHTNGNAPKCDCKLTELCETKELTNNFSHAMITTKPSEDILDPSKDLKPSTDGHQPALPHPCETEFDEIKNEILPPVIKRPKLEPMEISLESKHGPRVMNCSPQEEIKEKVALFEKPLQSEKVLRKIDTLANKKILKSTSHLGDRNSKESKDPSTVDGQRKLEKLIVKTDFLKNKHLLKKKKYIERKTLRVEDGTRNVKNINKSAEVGELAKTSNMDRMVGDKANNEKCKPPANTVQQSESSMNKLKSSSSSYKSHAQAPPLGKRRGRPKSRSDTKEVKKISVHEYLARQRALCSRLSGPKVDPREEPAEVRRRVVEKPSVERLGNNLLSQCLRPLSPAKINAKTKNIENEAVNQTQKSQPRTSGVYGSLHRKHKGPSGSHGKGSLVNKGLNQKSTSSREKIYLSPCESSRRTSDEGIRLTKLQIRRSPEKIGYFERRKSLDSSVLSKQSKSETKHSEAPKMLEFKLYPEFVSRSPTTQERKSEPKVAKETRVEGIQSKKEAWCSGVAPKKRWIDSSSDERGCHSPSALSSSSPASSKKNSSRPVNDTQTTFNVFRQMYREQRSKSLNSSL